MNEGGKKWREKKEGTLNTGEAFRKTNGNGRA